MKTELQTRENCRREEEEGAHLGWRGGGGRVDTGQEARGQRGAETARERRAAGLLHRDRSSRSRGEGRWGGDETR